MTDTAKKYWRDLALLPKRVSDDQNGISPKATIFEAVCIFLFKTPESEEYITKTYSPLNFYFGIRDLETTDDNRAYWIYFNEDNLTLGYWFTEKEFNQYFRMVKIGHKD